MAQQPRRAVRGRPLEELPRANYAANTPLLGEAFELPLGADTFDARLDRSELPDDPDDLVQVWHEISLDGGATWVKWGGYRTNGGEVLDQFGNVQMYSSSEVPLPEPNNPARLIRITTIPLKNIRTRQDAMCWRSQDSKPEHNEGPGRQDKE